MKYKEVVAKAKRHTRTGYGKIEFVDCPIWERGDQINLWTYWQGYQLEDIGKKGVDILLVGQDWGNPEKNAAVCKRITEIQDGVKGATYITTASPTDKRLIKMLKHLEIQSILQHRIRG